MSVHLHRGSLGAGLLPCSRLLPRKELLSDHGLLSRARLWLLAGLALISAAPARADYIHQTQAAREGTILELHVGREAIEAQLEIDAADRRHFQALLTPGQTTTNTGLALLDGRSGRPLSGRVASVETRRRTLRYDPNAPAAIDLRGVPVSVPVVSPLVTAVRIRYPLTQPPEQLILRPPLAQGEQKAATNIGFIVFHEDLPVSNYWYLSQPEPLQLNWNDPWRTRFQNPNLKRAHASSLTSYVTVDPYEVRHEVVVRFRDLAPLLGISLSGNQVVAPAQLEQIRRASERFFNQRPRTRINGRERQGGVVEVSFLTVDPKGVFQAKPKGSVHRAASTLLGISLSFPTETMARKVEVQWDLFSERIPTITAQASDAAGPFPYQLSPASPTLVWENVLRQPPVSRIEPVRQNRHTGGWWLLAAAGLAGVSTLVLLAGRRGLLMPPRAGVMGGFSLSAVLLGVALVQIPLQGPGALSEARASQVIEQLLANVYRAMEFRQEERVYDRLALSLSKAILSDVYLQQRRSLSSQQDGGAISRVSQVTVEQIRRLGWPGWGAPLRYAVTWKASGTVSHWGHSHQRQNRYQAEIELDAAGQTWKIGDLHLREEARVP